MRKALILAVALLQSAALLASPGDPAAALQHARQSIAAKQYAAAAEELKVALEAAQSLPEAERGQAIAALHFYSAVALAGMRSDAEAKAHLVEFLKLVPNARIASDKYDEHFVALFNEAHAPVGLPGSRPEFRFETYYPGFDTTFVSKPPAEDPTTWGISPALQILGSRREKQEWAAAETASDRAAFIEAFWKKRDPDPETPQNEFHEVFDRRVAFADKAFESPDGRGSTSDRGKVFVLLGPPASIRRRPLNERDQIVIYEREQLNGHLEQWVYAPQQLPVRVPKDSVTYRFITQKGIGDAVLQQEDPWAFKALAVAMNPNEEKKK